MKTRIRIITCYKPTKEIQERFDRLALLILKNTKKENFTKERSDKLRGTTLKNTFCDKAQNQ